MLKRLLLPIVLIPALAALPVGAAPEAPKDPPLPPEAAAVVNGEVLPLADLNQLMLKRHGAEILREMILKRLVDQEARRAGIEVTEPEIARRRGEATAELKKQVATEVTLESVLKAQGISEADFRDQVVARLTVEKLAVRDELCGAWVRLSVVRSSTPEKAQDLLAKLKGGADFAALATKESTDSSAAHGGDLGICFPGEVPPELEAAVSALGPGAVTEVVPSKVGYLIARVDARQAARPCPYAEICDEVVRRLEKSPPDQDVIERYLARLRRAARIQARPDLSGPAAGIVPPRTP